MYFKRKEFASLIRGGLAYRKANRKSQMLFPLSKMTEKLPSVTLPLKGVGYTILERVFTVLQGRQLSCLPFCFVHQGHSEKGVYPKRMGSKFFFFKGDPFQKGVNPFLQRCLP